MDKLFDNRWVMRIIALFLALMLYASVNIESNSEDKQGASNAGASTTVFSDETTVTDVPVIPYFDQENLVVTGIPESVEVNLQGATASITKARQLRDFEVYADLSNLSIGTHQVRLQYKDIADDLKVSIKPSVITVTIEEKVTKDFEVGVDLLNENQLEEGYLSDKPIVSPKSIQITASEDIIEEISSVKAKVDLQGGNETINRESTITVYDREGEVIPVEVEPSVVDVTVPIKSPSRDLPFKIIREGELKEGLSISSIESETKEITVFGPEDVINKLEFIDGITVDLSKITKDTVLEVDVPLPDGVTKVTPEKVKLEINVDEQEEKVFSDQPINAVGLTDGKTVEFLDPETGEMDVTILGAPNVIKDIKESDVELYVDLTDLSDGEHEVEVKVNGPQNITWSLQKKKVKVKISSASQGVE